MRTGGRLAIGYQGSAAHGRHEVMGSEGGKGRDTAEEKEGPLRHAVREEEEGCLGILHRTEERQWHSVCCKATGFNEIHCANRCTKDRDARWREVDGAVEKGMRLQAVHFEGSTTRLYEVLGVLVGRATTVHLEGSTAREVVMEEKMAERVSREWLCHR